MNLTSTQNTHSNLQLLAAQRWLYSKAKRLQRWRLVGTIGVTAAAPLVLLAVPNAGAVLAVIGAFWLLASKLILDGAERNTRERATKIQEQFDTEVYGLAWHPVIAGERVPPELISRASSNHGDNWEPLRDWYADPGPVPHWQAVLLCQQSNLTWDWRLRRAFAWITGVMAGLLFVAGIALSIFANLGLMDYLLGILIPASSALLRGCEVTKGHLRIATEKEELAVKVVRLATVEGRLAAQPTETECRQIQDKIYLLRQRGPLVPDWWYERLKRRYQVDMESATERLTSRITGG
jgi:hypothetical protein